MRPHDHITPKAFKVRLISMLILFIVLTGIFSLKNDPSFVEHYYSLGIFPYIRKGFQFLFNYVPFSVGDLFYLAIVASLIAGFIYFIRLIISKRFKTAGFAVMGFILRTQIAVTLFYLLWGGNYFRQPASIRLDLPDYEYSQPELIRITELLIDSANSNRQKLSLPEMQISSKDIFIPATAAVNQIHALHPSLIAICPKPKVSMFASILNYLGTAGYFNPFTGEAQINGQMPVYTQPFIACHEMAHQMGFGAEDEANFAGFIAARSSPDRLLRYSGYYLASQEFMVEVWRADSTEFKRLKESISPEVLSDFETEKNYWAMYRGETSRLSGIFYDNYLKANNQPGGLKTYNRMIKLSMSWYRKEGFLN